MENIKVLGNTVYHLKKFIIENYGQDFFDKVIATLPADVKETLSKSILSNNYYDVRVKVGLITAFRENIASIDEVAKMTTYECDSQINWLYGIAFKLISVNMLLGMMQMIWNKHFTGGTITPKSEDGGRNIIMPINAGYQITEAYAVHLEYYIKRLLEIVGNCRYESSSQVTGAETLNLFYKKI